METTIVMYPSLGMGHLISMVELAKFFLHQHPSLSITILIIPPSISVGPTLDYIRHVTATAPSIAFHDLPAVSIDRDALPSIESIVFETLHRYNPHVRRALESISSSAAVSAFIIDFFCFKSAPIATELQIPTYYFLTSGAHFTAFLLHLRALDETTVKSFKDMNALVHIPGVPPVPSSDMLMPVLDRTTTDYANFIAVSNSLSNSSGILINTFESLEVSPLGSLREGKCNPGGPTPPVFCVGPLLAAQRRDGEGHECLKWLDKQPRKSVVYICFGSVGLVSAAQSKAIAEGLERSGRRFLWVVRSPPPPPPAEPDLDVLLPAGFVERTAGRGMVVKMWAPQVAVLGHVAVGGFFTHCGWNSILEAVWAGVPMATWPLFAEQHFNRVVLVEGLGVAVRVEEAEDGFVAAKEVERRVRELIDGGGDVRKVVEEKSAEARAAMAEGGSSVAAVGKLLQLWTASGKEE